MFRMDVIRKLKVPGYVLLGADIEDVKSNLSNLDLKLALTDMEYMNFVKESLLMQDEAWGHFRYVYSESSVFGIFDGHIWIKAKIFEEPDVLEEYRNLANVENDWKYSELLDESKESDG